jgi:hypothetical protein
MVISQPYSEEWTLKGQKKEAECRVIRVREALYYRVLQETQFL